MSKKWSLPLPSVSGTVSLCCPSLCLSVTCVCGNLPTLHKPPYLFLSTIYSSSLILSSSLYIPPSLFLFPSLCLSLPQLRIEKAKSEPEHVICIMRVWWYLLRWQPKALWGYWKANYWEKHRGNGHTALTWQKHIHIFYNIKWCIP